MGKRIVSIIITLLVVTILTSPVPLSQASLYGVRDIGFNVNQSTLRSDGSEAGEPPSVYEEGEATVVHVVLVTGDVVTVTQYRSGRRSFAVSGAEPNEGFAVFATRNETYVVPKSADMRKLDLALFDIDYLLREEYYKLDSVPILISSTSKVSVSSVATDPDIRGSVTKVFKSIPAIAAKAKFEKVRSLYQALMKKTDVAKVWLDKKIHPSLDESLPIIGLQNPSNPVWDSGYTGVGMRIAILDTGIDPTHPDVGPRIVGAQDFTDDGTVDDLHGHGTHVAATAAGDATASTSPTDPSGKFKGVAYQASLINAKVVNQYDFGYSSWLIDAIEWAVGDPQGADVISLSLGYGTSDGNDPLAQAVDAAVDSGVVACVAAGNDGYAPWHYFTVTTPGSARKAITVGATDKSDQLAGFSSRGPVTGGEIRLKPDVVAPGVDIMSARAANSRYGWATNPDGSTSGPPNYPPYYTWGWSGTSMATPHVAGVAALVLQSHPGWAPWQIKDAIMNTAVHLDGYNVYQEGAGRVFAPAAVFTTALLDESTYSFGVITEGSATRSHTYTVYNYGGGPITVDLSVNLIDVATGSDWTAGHASTSVLTLDIGSAASGTFGLSLDMGGLPLSMYSGVLIATVRGTGQQLRSAFGFARMNTLTVTKLDMAGNPASGWPVWKWKVNPSSELDYWFNAWEIWTDNNGQAVFYHTGGNYELVTLTWKDNAQIFTIADNLAVSGNMASTLDERTTNRVDFDPNKSGQTIAAVRTQMYYPSTPGIVPDAWPWWFYIIWSYPASTESYISSVSSSWKATFGYSYFPSSDFDVTDWQTINTGEWHDLLYASNGIFGPMHFVPDYSQLVKKWSVYPVNLGPNLGAYRWANTWSRLFDDPSTGFIPWWYSDWAFSWKMSLPQARVEYLSPDVWYYQCLEKVWDIPWQWTSGWLWEGPYSAWSGGTPEERWNTAFSNQLFGWVDPNDPSDHLELWGHAIMDGWKYGGHGYRDYGRWPAGTLELTGPAGPIYSGSIDDSFDWWFFPHNPGLHRATLDATGTQQLSTHVIATYTFDTSVPGSILPWGQIDVPQICFEPNMLDLENTASAGQVAVGIRARSWSDPEKPMSSVQAWYSINDGASWNSLTVNPGGWTNYYLVKLANLSDAYVSLRARATNSLGNAVTQTTIRAFYIREVAAGLPSSFGPSASAMIDSPAKTVYFIFPDSDPAHKKPPGVGYASVSDWTALGYVYGSLANMPQVTALDTNSTYIDQTTGAPKLRNSIIILFGGTLVNALVHYYEENRIAPLWWSLEGGWSTGTLYYRTRSGAVGASMPIRTVGGGSADLALYEVFEDPFGNTVLIFSAFGWKGTFTSGLYFKTVLCQGDNLAGLTDSWYFYSWTDKNGNRFVEDYEVNPTPVNHGD